MGFFDRRNLAGLQTTAKYAPRRKRGGRRPFLLGQDFCSVKNFPTENCLRQRRSSPFLSKNALTMKIVGYWGKAPRSYINFYFFPNFLKDFFIYKV